MNSSTRVLPSLCFLKAMLFIDVTSPSGLRWRTYSKGKRKDLVAGSKTFNKRTHKTYWTVCIEGASYFAHRIVYYIQTGIDPVGSVIDHINGDGTCNQFSNLRLVTQRKNCLSHKLYSNNTSGICGVRFNEAASKYTAWIYIQRKQIHLGYFETFEEAIDARKEAERKRDDDAQALLPDNLK